MNLKIKKNSLTIKTLIYLVAFSVVILLFLWVIQVVFLKIFYERYQVHNITNIANAISKSKNDLNSELETLAYENDICIELYVGNEAIGYNILNRDCILRNRNSAIINAKSELLSSDSMRSLVRVTNPLNDSKSLIYGLRLGNNAYVFLNTKLEDVNSTNSLLINQLIYITLVVIVLAIIVSYFVSWKLNNPIIKITANARKMAEGDYEIDTEDYGIAEINELSDALNYARSEAKNTDEIRRDLMANVSHDLKTPLTMIKAYAEMAIDLNSENKAKREENLEVIIAEADRLNSLVNDILDLSKLQTGNSELKIEKYDLVSEINEILKRYEFIKETENYKLVTDMPEAAIVMADKNKINQVLYNLINNAINYTGKDLTVKINVKHTKKGFLVEIIDSGKGIAKEDLNLIWTKYYKKEKNHRRNVVGTGLGLSIVKSILTDHKFDYGVESKKGKGTKFYFTVKNK